MVKVRLDEKIGTECWYPDAGFGMSEFEDRLRVRHMIPSKALVPFRSGAIRDGGDLCFVSLEFSIFGVQPKIGSRRASFMPVCGGDLS